jgi:hypothetical protein
MKNKDLGFDINEIDDIFHADNEVIDGMEVVNIPIEDIGIEAEGKAKTLIEDLTKFYYDEEFLKQNPNFRKRVDNDMESLRMLIKMRAADEVTHDVLIKAIAGNSGNASLYRALTTVQSTILSITTKIEGIVNNLTSMIKNYQLEINFKQELNTEEKSPDEVDDKTTTHRGSKAFIEQMQRIENKYLLDGDNTSIE